MSKAPTRFSLALDLAYAAMTVLFADHVAQNTLQNANRVKKSSSQVLPLEEEFSDLFVSRKHFVGRICKAVCTDLPDFFYANGRTARRRVHALLRTTVMPSIAVRALADTIGCSSRGDSTFNLLPYSSEVHRCSREIGVLDECLRVFWITDGDLDAQWRTVRNELLKIRAELASRTGGAK